MSSLDNETRDSVSPILIKTKLQRPRLGQDLIPRPQLLERLNRGVDRKLTLISAQAGAGKTTVLAQWLEASHLDSAWLSLDEHDNDLMVFLNYLCAAIGTVFPDACGEVLELLEAPQTPPLRIITTMLINELDKLLGGSDPTNQDPKSSASFILALDDYYKIAEPAIHELLSELIAYLPRRMNLAISTRVDPPLPLAGIRARSELTELRTADLRLGRAEAAALLEKTAGRKVSDETIEIFNDKTDGWAAGLRLAALSIRNLPEDRDLVERFKGTSSAILGDYLVNEVLSQQPPDHQKFLLQTSILERFDADLCDAVIWKGDDEATTTNPDFKPSRAILREINEANLFLIPLDQEARWYRYHHLFRDLLQNRLHRSYRTVHIAELHERASLWFERNGFIEEALKHSFNSGDLKKASKIVSRQRYQLMNQAHWQRLDRFLKLFPAEFIDRQPDLLILKAWLLYHQTHYIQLPTTLDKLEGVLDQNPSPPDAIRNLKGEISALRSLLAYYKTDVEETAAEAEYALENTSPELWIVRILARIYLAGSYQMQGELRQAYEIVYKGMDEETNQDRFFKATMLVTICSLHWVMADLPGLKLAATQSIELYKDPYSVQIRGHAHYHLGTAYYHQNNLSEAEEHFTTVAQRPYLNYGDAYAHSSFGLSLLYQAQGRHEEAHRTAGKVVAHMVETGNMTLLQEAQAFQAELALRQGRLAFAERWAAQFESIPPLTPSHRLYRPILTLVKIWLAADSADLRQRAADLLDQLQEYNERIHNISVLIEVLALQAIRHAGEEAEQEALERLERAIGLAEPGGCIRLFVDLGSPIDHLIQKLHNLGVSVEYTQGILEAFPTSGVVRSDPTTGTREQSLRAVAEPLTDRELEVLELLAERLTNKEIAEKLVISDGTVKTHTLKIYSKLDVHDRRQAAAKARELGILPKG